LINTWNSLPPKPHPRPNNCPHPKDCWALYFRTQNFEGSEVVCCNGCFPPPPTRYEECEAAAGRLKGTRHRACYGPLGEPLKLLYEEAD